MLSEFPVDLLIHRGAMNLIDWPALARNALWILGLAIVLAALSYTSWLATSRGVRLSRALGWPAFSMPSSAGLLLFSASLAWGAIRPWERILWIILCLAFLAQVGLDWRSVRARGWQSEENSGSPK